MTSTFCVVPERYSVTLKRAINSQKEGGKGLSLHGIIERRSGVEISNIRQTRVRTRGSDKSRKVTAPYTTHCVSASGELDHLRGREPLLSKAFSERLNVVFRQRRVVTRLSFPDVESACMERDNRASTGSDGHDTTYGYDIGT